MAEDPPGLTSYYAFLGKRAPLRIARVKKQINKSQKSFKQ